MSLDKEEQFCLLEEYKESLRRCASIIPDWENISKNELCRLYKVHKDDPLLQSAYFAAIMYKYWHLISKYYYMSSNVATPEDCYEWLEDSVYGCLKASSWDREDSTIYKDPNGPDKVINRCMKCARLTYYQFINRKKRKDNFGMLSLEEMTELFGTTVSEPHGENDIDRFSSTYSIQEYVKQLWNKKDYFIAVLIDAIVTQDVFDISSTQSRGVSVKFSLRKLTRFMSTISESYITDFANRYNLSYDDAEAGMAYFRKYKPPTIKGKIQVGLERLQHDSFVNLLRGGGS